MDEFEKIKTFSEGLAEREKNISVQQNETSADETPSEQSDLPQYFSQFQRTVPTEETRESKRLLWIMLILSGIVVGSVMAGLAYRKPEMEETEIVVISPTPLPVKVLPENPGGLDIPDTDKVVYNRTNEVVSTPVVESLFPEPEQPMLPDEFVEPEEKEETLVSLTPEEVMVPVVEENDVPIFEQVERANAESVENLQEVIEEKTEETPHQEPVKKIWPDVKIVPVPMSKPTAVSGTPKEVQKNVVSNISKESAKDIWHAQLLSSASKAKVESSWKRISKQQAALLSDMPYKIVTASIPGKGTFYRLQVGEFSTKEMVVNLCAKLKKKKQECIPVK